MVSVCCEDCRNEKLKSKVLSKMLINEHCNIIGDYLGCDTCIKMKPILNDTIYQTLNPEQQQIFVYIKMCPFPKWEKELYENNRWIKEVEEAYNNMYVKDFFTNNYEKFNDEFFPYAYIDLFDYIFAMCYAEWVNGRFKIKFDRELRRKILNITGAWNYY